MQSQFGLAREPLYKRLIDKQFPPGTQINRFRRVYGARALPCCEDRNKIQPGAHTSWSPLENLSDYLVS